jgi:uncharacterized protein
MKRRLVRRSRPAVARRRTGALVGVSRFRDPDTGGERFGLDILDLDAGQREPARIPLDFFGHGLAFRPDRPREAVLFGKRGQGGCALDLVARRVVQTIAPMPGHVFYGHAAYASDGRALFVVETDLASRNGAISIRDTTTFATIGALSSYGIAPHDCRLIENGRVLVVTHGGGPIGSPSLPCVTFVDVRTGVLVERHEMRNRNLNAGHVAVAADREFAVVSAPRDGLPALTSLGGVSLRRAGQPWTQLSAPAAVASRLVGESLSLAIHRPSRTVLATHPQGDLITFWSLGSGEFVGSLDLPGPRGVTLTLDERLYAVSYGSDARLLLIEAQSVRALADRPFEPGAFGGAHLYAWAA